MKILLGVTGGVAAYKSLELLRLFIKNGDEVQVVMTSGAKQFIQPLSFQALSGKPVRDSLFDENQEAGMGHIELARWADLIIIAPASAETMAKLSIGRADDLLMTLCLATDKPIMLVPAMNSLMWHNLATQENINILQQRGFAVLSPDSGEQACGEVGEGRMPEPPHIFEFTMNLYARVQQDCQAELKLSEFWQGKHLLITAGPTQEAIDPVRFISNRSSGKMGFAIAKIALQAGAKVTLITGPVVLLTPQDVARVNVKTADEMFDAVKSCYSDCDVFIAAAAVADFKVANPAKLKLKKQLDQNEMIIKLVKNSDIVAWVATQIDKPFVVGFAAETHNVIEYAKGKLKDKNLDMICANKVGAEIGFARDENSLTLITTDIEKPLALSSKHLQAQGLLEFISSNFFMQRSLKE